MPGLLDRLRVLVLEDEFLIVLDVEQICRDHGAREVIIARTIEEAQGALDSGAFDAAIIDMMLGHESTLGFAQNLRARAIPFIFGTGYAETDEVAGLFPGVRLVGKPYADTDLVQALAATCGRG